MLGELLGPGLAQVQVPVKVTLQNAGSVCRWGVIFAAASTDTEVITIFLTM